MKSLWILWMAGMILFSNQHCTAEGEDMNPKPKQVAGGDVQRGITLPEPRTHSDCSVEEALLRRRSVRNYKAEPLNLQELGQVLWAAYGITKEMPLPMFLRGGLRTAPSAGALYPLEIFVVAGEVTGLTPGIYRYRSAGHALELVAAGDRRQELAKAAWDQTFIARAPVVLVYAAVFARTTGKYGERGRARYVCMDLGHSAQNVYLQAEALGLGTCAVGAFDDAAVAKVVGLKNEEEPLYLMPVGKK
ncbi:MAG: SagB/ThcOx family dehydrogenase [candidate division KSB1 bacterium]|nr:SagB/ThcOx family dehydrogenase [candidate division KSB1 bacterium]MDZ7393968.1 SagB/ThcOx family dehydrogenase [candidate division KSB1 bacterium]MDZ7412606.1 SagB/ThcOx family dehydrogenase [candidate division KSB1 bacterium]